MEIRDGDLKAIAQPLDWWGVNYYTPMRVCKDRDLTADYPQAVSVPPSGDVDLTDIGWEVYEDGLSDLLSDLYARYDLPPCYITENGACYNDGPNGGTVNDQRRIDYLDAHLGAAANALDQGVPLKGYFLWSLMDNFEWAEGYKMRFGVVHVDYDSQIRTLKDSALWYRSLISARKSEGE